jgi:hypothetical protein
MESNFLNCHIFLDSSDVFYQTVKMGMLDNYHIESWNLRALVLSRCLFSNYWEYLDCQDDDVWLGPCRKLRLKGISFAEMSVFKLSRISWLSRCYFLYCPDSEFWLIVIKADNLEVMGLNFLLKRQFFKHHSFGSTAWSKKG